MTDYALGATIYAKFTTRQFSTGAPFTLAGTPELAIYADDSVVQIGPAGSPAASGIKLDTNFDGVTGLNHITIVATSANGFATNTDYSVVIAAGTVDGVSAVGEVVFSFSIEKSQSNVKFVNGTAQTAGDLFPAIQGIGTAGGAAINQDAATDNSAGGISGVTSATTKLGTIVGAFGNTSFVNGVVQTLNIDAGQTTGPTIAYQFLTGGGATPIQAVFTGFVGTTAARSFTVQAWKHTTGEWEGIGTITGQTGSANIVKMFTLYARHAGTSSAELGKVYIRFLGAGTNTPTLTIDQLYVSYGVTVQSSVVLSGTASAGTTSSITLAGGSSTSGLYVGAGVIIVGGTGMGQSRYIVGYDGATKIAKVARHWSTAPDATSQFSVVADNQIPFIHMGQASGGGATSITLELLTASAIDDIYKGQAIRILDGTGDDQERMIIAYNGTTKVATVDRAWAVNPVSGSYYGTLMNSVVWAGGGLIDTLTTYTGNTKQTADVATLITTVGAAGAGLTAIPEVDANVTKMNSATVQGTGVAGDLWRG